MKSFYAITSSQYMILACRIDANDCRKEWKKIYLEQGVCMQYYPLKGKTLDMGLFTDTLTVIDCVCSVGV